MPEPKLKQFLTPAPVTLPIIEFDIDISSQGKNFGINFHLDTQNFEALSQISGQLKDKLKFGKQAHMAVMKQVQTVVASYQQSPLLFPIDEEAIVRRTGNTLTLQS